MLINYDDDWPRRRGRHRRPVRIRGHSSPSGSSRLRCGVVLPNAPLDRVQHPRPHVHLRPRPPDRPPQRQPSPPQPLHKRAGPPRRAARHRGDRPAPTKATAATEDDACSPKRTHRGDPHLRSSTSTATHRVRSYTHSPPKQQQHNGKPEPRPCSSETQAQLMFNRYAQPSTAEQGVLTRALSLNRPERWRRR